MDQNGQLLRMYESMSTIERCDRRFRKLLSSGEIFFVGYYSPRGQEAIPVGTAANLSDDDYLVTIYRGMHDMIAKGVPLRDLWAEFLGKATGTCKGKGGSMHITDPSVGAMLTTGIVGSGMPIANGLAWASQLRGDGRVTVCNFGDGASNIGAFHEALNLASLWKLPVVFICQNNRYAEHSAYSVGTSVERISERGQAYAMPAVTIDGNDVMEVRSATGEAIDRARSGQGPTLIEAMTFRYFGHTFGDQSHYIAREEMECAMATDPIPRFRTLLLDGGYATESELDAMDEEIERAIGDAVDFAIESPYPGPEELMTDVYHSGVSACQH